MTRGILWGRPDDNDEWNKKISNCAAEVLIAVLHVQYVYMFVRRGYGGLSVLCSTQIT